MSMSVSVVWMRLGVRFVLLTPSTGMNLPRGTSKRVPCPMTTEDFWMNLQTHYELRLYRRVLRGAVETNTPLSVA